MNEQEDTIETITLQCDIRDEQILIDTDWEKYYLLRARCETCKIKTWHYVYSIKRRLNSIHIVDTKNNCIEHSFADTPDLIKAGWSIEDAGIKIRYNNNTSVLSSP